MTHDHATATLHETHHQLVRTRDVPTRKRFVLRALWDLIFLDLCVLRHGFRGVRDAVVSTPVAAGPHESIDRRILIRSVHRASIYYIRQVHCLQRSAAVTRMLRRHGIAATLVVGTQVAPMRSHAWVEVDGEIVSDNKRDRLQHYGVLDRW